MSNHSHSHENSSNGTALTSRTWKTGTVPPQQPHGWGSTTYSGPAARR